MSASGIILLGISSIIAQFLLLRGFIDVFGGSEWTIALLLGGWSLFGGLGALLGRVVDRGSAMSRGIWRHALHLLLGWLPFLALLLLARLQGSLMIGMLADLRGAFAGMLVCVAPYALFAGLLLVLYARDGGAVLISSPARAFVLDMAGAGLGGLLFGLILSHKVSDLTSALLLAGINGLYLMASRARLALVAGALSLTTVACVIPFGPQLLLTLWSSQNTLTLQSVRSGPLGTYLVAEGHGEHFLYHDGLPLASSGDPADAEESVHFAMALHPSPSRVLLVSGGVNGLLEEVLKYPGVTSIDLVEQDPLRLTLSRELHQGATSDPRVRMIVDDPRRFLGAATDTYDVIIMHAGDPVSAGVSRFYTRQSFGEIARRLAPTGILSFSLGGAANYTGPALRLYNASVHGALKEVFPHIAVYPASRNIFVASTAPLGESSIAARLNERKIATRYVRAENLASMLAPDRMSQVAHEVSASTAPNSDFHPLAEKAYLAFLLQRADETLIGPLLFMLALALLAVFVLWQTRRQFTYGPILGSGFTAMGSQVILLLALQVLCGELYRFMPLIIVAYMLASCVGSLILSRRRARRPRRLFLALDGLIIAAAVLSPLLIFWLTSLPPAWKTGSPAIALITLLSAVFGFLVGGQFALSEQCGDRGADVSLLFFCDFLGAALGAFAVGLFIIPALGALFTFAVLGLIKIPIFLGSLSQARRTSARRPGIETKDASVPEDPGPAAPRLALPGLVTSAILWYAALAFILTIGREDSSLALSALCLDPWYLRLAGAALIGVLLAALISSFPRRDGERGPAARPPRGVRQGFALMRHGVTFLFLPAAVFPLVRCYFKVPYLLCHVCPRPCPFGLLRPYLVPFALIANLNKRTWCQRFCPVGRLSECTPWLAPSARRSGLRKLLTGSSVLVVACCLAGYFKVAADELTEGDLSWNLFHLLYRNSYEVATAALVAALLLWFVTLWIPRLFCRALCPIGGTSALFATAERKLAHGRGTPGAGPCPREALP